MAKYKNIKAKDTEIKFLRSELENLKEDNSKTGNKKAKRIMNKIIHNQLFRFHNSISLWKSAIEDFENPYYPLNEDLIRVYNDAVLDPHLSALMESRKKKTTGSDFKIVDEKGEEIDDQTKMIDKQWFVDAMSIALDSKFYGFSLLQFGDKNGNGDFETVDVVPREFVYAQKKLVRDASTSTTGKPFSSFAAWVLPAGNPSDLGLLSKAVPLTIYKKTALGSWADYTDIYGAPLRLGKTNVRDSETRENMSEMLENMTSSTWAVIDKEDEVEMVQGSNTDSFQTFDTQVERLNSEMSKLIVSSTMTIDDGSSRSQSEVHQTSTNQIAKSDSRWVESWVNNCLIPFLVKYHGFKITGQFMFDTTEVLTVSEQFEIDNELLKSGKYKIPASYITEKYVTPVEEIEEPEPMQPMQPKENDVPTS